MDYEIEIDNENHMDHKDEDTFSLEDMDHEDEMDDCNLLETASSGTAEKPKGTIPICSRRRRAKCWKNFTIVELLDDGRFNVTCNHCKKNFCLNLRKNGTNTLNRHMKSCSKTPGSTPRSSIRKLDMMVFREMIAVAIIEHDLPFSFVEYQRIREAFAYANPDIEFWSRNTAAADVLKIFEKEKKKLKEVLTKIPSRICLTTDLWRAITIEGYLCLTAHYIDGDWNLQTKILSFCAFPPPHSGFAIATKLIELLRGWGLEKKVFSLTVDNASANDNMQGILKRKLQKELICNGDFFHVRCSAHVLNLIVQDGLAVISGALEKIRDSIKFVKGSQSRENVFQNCMETVGVQAKAGLVLDVATRWNSTYLMLSRAIFFKDVFRNMAEVEKSYKSLPSNIEWKRGESVCDLLKPFAEMTKLISGSSYPTANLYFLHVWEIEMWLKAHEDSEDDLICDAVKSMKLKFDKYWEEYSDILAIAAVLDPRLKFSFLDYCFTTLDSFTASSKLAHVRRKMKELFGAYKSNTSNSTVTTSQVETLQEDIPSGYGGFYSYISQKDCRNPCPRLVLICF